MVGQNKYDSHRFSGRRLMVDVLVFVLLVSGVLYFLYLVDEREFAASRTACLKTLEIVNTNAGAYRKLLNDAASSKSTYAADDLSDGQLMRILTENMMVKPPQTVSCTGRNRKQIRLQTAKLEANARWFEQHAQRLRRAIEDVGASHAMKVLNDARVQLEVRIAEGDELLKNSSGRVQDESTRTALSKALRDARSIRGNDPKSYRDGVKPLENAIKQVISSIEAKTQT